MVEDDDKNSKSGVMGSDVPLTPTPLHSILLAPFASKLVVAITVGFVDTCNLGNERIIRIGIAKQRADA